MTLRELIADFRTITGDLADPYFWSNADLIGYANQAENEAARRALLIADTADMDVRANEPLVELGASILLVRRARLAGAGKTLRILGWRTVEETTPDWEDAAGTPYAAIPDWVSGALRLTPIPGVDDQINAAIYRLPRHPMEAPDDSPEIHAQYHKALVDHMLELGYSKHDADTFDPQAAAYYAGRFTATFGPPASMVSETAAARDVSRDRHSPPL